MAFNLANLFVSITGDDAPLQKQVEGVRGQLSGMGVAIGVAAGNLLSSAISGSVSALGGFIARGISGATSLYETVNKVKEVFRESADGIISQADRMSAAFGFPKQALLDASAAFGLMGKAAGLSNPEASAMATTLTKLAADATSFYDVPMDVALEKIRSGLAGEALPMRDFGVLLSEEAVKAEAVAMGLGRAGKEIDDHAKVMARASLIQKGLAVATGDLERTADSTANQWRKLAGNMENFSVSVGTSLAPAIKEIVNMAGDMMARLSAAFESNKDTIAGWAKSFADAIKSIPQAWDEFQTGISINALRAQKSLAEAAGHGPPGMIAGGLAALGLMTPETASPKGLDAAIDQLADDLRKRNEERAGITPEAAAAMRDATAGVLALAGSDALKGLAAMRDFGAGALSSAGDDAIKGMPRDSVLKNVGIPSLESFGLGALATGALQARKEARDEREKKHPFESRSFDADEFYYKLREQALSGPDDTAKKQLEEQAATRRASEKIAELIGGGALVARFA